MKTIDSVGNWRLHIREEQSSVTILRALTCDKHAVLPDTLLGKPVRTLGRQAFLASGACTDGQELCLVHGRLSGHEVWSNGKIETLYLPDSLEAVDDYAFLSCWGMHTLHVPESVRRWGECTFNSCNSLRSIHLRADSTSELIAVFVRDISRELTLTLEAPTARFLFPEYAEVYEESYISQAVEFAYSIAGAGYPYHHQTFDGRRFSPRKYDALWTAFLKERHDPRSALLLAWHRLHTPMELSDKAAAAYTAYLIAHAEEALCLLTETYGSEEVRFLLKTVKPSAEALSRAAALARARGATETLAVLMEAQRGERPRARERSFDL